MGVMPEATATRRQATVATAAAAENAGRPRPSLFAESALNPVATAVAVIQALLWFFALPALMKPFWTQFWSGLSPLAGQVLMNSMGLLYFISYAIVITPIYYGNYPFFEQYKISDKPWAWRSEKKADRDRFWARRRSTQALQTPRGSLHEGGSQIFFYADVFANSILLILLVLC